jgi:uncharacterized protein
MVMEYLLHIKVTTRTSHNQIMGDICSDVLQVRLTASPVDGRANLALIKLLAEKLHIPKSNISIVKGEKKRNKIVKVFLKQTKPDYSCD